MAVYAVIEPETNPGNVEMVLKHKEWNQRSYKVAIISNNVCSLRLWQINSLDFMSRAVFYQVASKENETALFHQPSTMKGVDLTVFLH